MKGSPGGGERSPKPTRLPAPCQHKCRRERLWDSGFLEVRWRGGGIASDPPAVPDCV